MIKFTKNSEAIARVLPITTSASGDMSSCLNTFIYLCAEMPSSSWGLGFAGSNGRSRADLISGSRDFSITFCAVTRATVKNGTTCGIIRSDPGLFLMQQNGRIRVRLSGLIEHEGFDCERRISSAAEDGGLYRINDRGAIVEKGNRRPRNFTRCRS